MEKNLRILARALEVAPSELHSVSQVHGETVLEAAGPGPEGALCAVSGTADAIFTGRGGAAVGVKTADCVPILLADPAAKQVAAVHSGWKGTELEIVRRAVEALVGRGAKLDALRIAIGPCIRACCYEVSPELAEKFEARFGAAAVRREEGTRPHLDLVAALLRSLHAAGVSDTQVDVLERCTSCEPSRFFSHRRDRGVTGRHMSVAVCRF